MTASSLSALLLPDPSLSIDHNSKKGQTYAIITMPSTTLLYPPDVDPASPNIIVFTYCLCLNSTLNMARRRELMLHGIIWIS